jgi:hypothetical protein
MEPTPEEATSPAEAPTDWECNWCSCYFSSKQALQKHQEKGVCMKKGYICMRCLQLWNTPSELRRHQTSQRKCKQNNYCVLQRMDDDSVRVVEKKDT